jgi:hypothetical protein
MLTARLSVEACEGWEKWAGAQGVTLSSLLEAIGLSLAEDETWNRPFDQMLPQIQQTVRRAHAIQRERKRRR